MDFAARVAQFCGIHLVLSVVAAAITGIVYLVCTANVYAAYNTDRSSLYDPQIPICFTLPDIEPLLSVASLQPIPLFFKIVTGSPSAAFGLLFLIYGIWFFAFIGSLTAASRATWAFARDGGIPASSLWKKVNARTQVPINAVLLSAVVNALLGLIYLGSYAAFNAFTGVATICLGASYGFPILCSVLRKRALVKDAPFSLGKFGMAIVSGGGINSFFCGLMTWLYHFIKECHNPHLDHVLHRFILHADRHSCYSGKYELRLRCFRWIFRHRNYVVRRKRTTPL